MQEDWSPLAYERIKRGDEKTLMTRSPEGATGSSKHEKGQAEGWGPGHAAERSSLFSQHGELSNFQAEVARYSRVDKIWNQ